MSKANISPLVLDGNDVKLRILAERAATKTPVHVDWVRFTCLLRNAPFPGADRLMPESMADLNIWDAAYRKAEMQKVLNEIPDYEFLPSTQALYLAEEICKALGPDFSVFPEVKKGQDFYKCRWSIVRNLQECAWVGYLAAGESPQKKAQDSTIHANIHGTATTFALPGWNDRLASVIDAHEGKLTRADLAVDFFEGLPGGMEQVKAEYEAGLCHINGRRLKFSVAGDWSSRPEDGRSLYFGSREAGKITNVYEKGHQLFGFAAGSKWMRVELRYGNKLRVLSSDILRRPADFFSGASEWHAATLHKADAIATPEPVPTNPRLQLETVQAEVHRNITWAMATAAPTIAAAFRFLDLDGFLELCNWETKKLPGRLQKFKASELEKAFKKVIGNFSSGGGFSPSLVAV